MTVTMRAECTVCGQSRAIFAAFCPTCEGRLPESAFDANRYVEPLCRACARTFQRCEGCPPICFECGCLQQSVSCEHEWCGECARRACV